MRRATPVGRLRSTVAATRSKRARSKARPRTRNAGVPCGARGKLLRATPVEMPSSSIFPTERVIVLRVVLNATTHASREVACARRRRAGALHGRPARHTRRALRERLVVGFRAFRSSPCATRRFLPEGTVAAAQVHASSPGGVGSRVEEAALPGRRRVSLGHLCTLPRGHELTQIMARRVRRRMCYGQLCHSSYEDCSPASVRCEQQFLDGGSGCARSLGAIVCPDSHLCRFDATTSGAPRTKYESIVCWPHSLPSTTLSASLASSPTPAASAANAAAAAQPSSTPPPWPPADPQPPAPPSLPPTPPHSPPLPPHTSIHMFTSLQSMDLHNS